LGDEILDQEGNINTKKLADIVFADREKLLLLERITHSALYERLEEEFKKLPEHAIAVVEASLVLEKKTQGRYDFVGGRSKNTTPLTHKSFEVRI
jgi:dephospho-CoA kinase